MRGDLLYICRRCGAEFAGRTVPNVALALAVVRGRAELPPEWGLRHAGDLEAEQHCCRDHEWGIGDVAGGRETPMPGEGESHA